MCKEFLNEIIEEAALQKCRISAQNKKRLTVARHHWFFFCWGGGTEDANCAVCLVFSSLLKKLACCIK